MGFLDFICRPIEFRKELARNRNRLVRVAFAWTRNRALAEDLVQEAMLKALKHRHQLRDSAAQDAWLFSILTNCYRDHFRRHRDWDDIDEIEVATEWTPESENGRNEVVAKVRTAVAKLPDGQRQVLTLVDLEGFSYVEVAQILTIPVGTVMSRLCRARQALKVLLAPELSQPASPDATLATPTRIRRVK